MDAQEIYHRLMRDARKLGSQRALAARIGISPAYLSDVIRGRRNAGPAITKYLGIERRVTYRSTK